MRHTLKGEYPSRHIWLDGDYLSPIASQEVRNHSPDGFNWGYGGSGPSQLALAIVLKLTGKSANYQPFKQDVIAKIPQGQSFQIEFDWEETIE